MAGLAPYSLTLSDLQRVLGQLPTAPPGSGGAWLDGTTVRYSLLGSVSNALGWFVSVNFQGLDNGGTLPGTNGTDWFAATASDITYVKSRGTGPARLPFLWERMQPQLNGALDTAYLAAVKSVADAALAAGTKIFIDCHNYMRRPTFSQTATAPYTISGYHGVDNPDGVVTRAHLVDLWTKLATYFKGHAGIAGYDLMNEPTSDNHFGASGNGTSAELAPIMQACVNAIAAVDTTVTIWVEGTAYSSAKNWVSGNASYPLNDPYNQIIYSGHCYPDYDHSGTHFGYAQNVTPPKNPDGSYQGDPLTPTTLVDISTGFVNWCASHNVKGHIGETNVGIDDPRWLTVLDNGLAYWKANGIGVNLWLYGANFPANPYNLYPYSGQQSAQWAVIQKELGLPTPPAALFGPSNGASGVASAAFTLSVVGYLAAAKTYTPSSTVAGTFSPASLTVQPGFNPAGGTFTFTPSSAAVGTISVSDGTTTSTPIAFSSDPANPVNSLAVAATKYSNWSASQAGINTNSTFATDETGGNTAARFTDNTTAGVQHIFNGPSFTAVPNSPLEIRMDLLPVGLKNVALSVRSGSSFGVTVDLVNNVVKSGSNAGGATLLDASVTTGTNGFKIVRFKGRLAASDLKATLFVTALNATFQSAYAGTGADMYADKVAAYFAPIETVAGPPLSTSIPVVAVTSGSPGVGGTYTVTAPAFVNGTPTSLAYQWLRDGVAISGATSASYTTTSADDGHKLIAQVVATNGQGSTTLSSASVSINIPWTVTAGNLITSQDPSGASWTRTSAAGDTLIVTPNYTAGGFAPDGQSYPTRVQIMSPNGYTASLGFSVNHAAGSQSCFIRTNPGTGDGAAYINLRSGANGDNNINLDNSSGASGYPTGAWNLVSGPVAANEPFYFLARPSNTVQDFLIWGERLAVESPAQPYATAPAGSSAAPVTSGLVGSLDPSQAGTLTTSGASITAISGSDGTTYTATGSGANAPTLVNDTVTVGGASVSRAAMRFTAASTQYMDWGAIASALGTGGGGPFTRVMILKHATLTATTCLMSHADPAGPSQQNRCDIYSISDGSYHSRRCGPTNGTFNDAVSAAAGDATNVHCIIDHQPAGATATVGISADHTAEATGATTAAAPVGATATTIGARRYINTTYDIPINADVFRVLVFNRELSTAEKASVMNWASQFYGSP